MENTTKIEAPAPCRPDVRQYPRWALVTILAIVVLGAWLRAAELVRVWGRPVEPDVASIVPVAQVRSPVNFLAPHVREPAWIAQLQLTRALCGVRGEDLQHARLMMFPWSMMSIVLMAGLCFRVFRSPILSVFGALCLALSDVEITTAVTGLRQPMTTALILAVLCAWWSTRRPTRPALIAGIVAATLLSYTRAELVYWSLAVPLTFALVGAWPWKHAGIATAAVVVLVVPLHVSRAQLDVAPTDLHMTWFKNYEFRDTPGNVTTAQFLLTPYAPPYSSLIDYHFSRRPFRQLVAWSTYGASRALTLSARSLHLFALVGLLVLPLWRFRRSFGIALLLLIAPYSFILTIGAPRYVQVAYPLMVLAACAPLWGIGQLVGKNGTWKARTQRLFERLDDGPGYKHQRWLSVALGVLVLGLITIAPLLGSEPRAHAAALRSSYCAGALPLEGRLALRALDAGEVEAASRHLRSASAVSENAGPSKVAFLDAVAARIVVARGDVPRALPLALRAASLAANAQDLAVRRFTFAVLARCADASGNAALARDAATRARSIPSPDDPASFPRVLREDEKLIRRLTANQ